MCSDKPINIVFRWVSYHLLAYSRHRVIGVSICVYLVHVQLRITFYEFMYHLFKWIQLVVFCIETIPRGGLFDITFLPNVSY